MIQLRTDNGTTGRFKPVWLLALYISLPVWGVLIADSITFNIKLSVLTTLYLHAPGFLLAILTSNIKEAIHSPNLILICVYNCLFYYIVILSIIALWRRFKQRKSGVKSIVNWPAMLLGVLVVFFYIAASSLYPYRMNLVPIQVKSLSQPNPTSYVFPVPLPKLREQILYGLRHGWERRAKFFGDLGFVIIQRRDTIEPVYLSFETSEYPVFGKEVFKDPHNSNDLYLSCNSVISSRTYFALDDPLPYEVAFHIHFVPVGNDSTKVTVMAINPGVLKGVAGWGPHGLYSMQISVEPTTIEEYTILLYIGFLLEEDSMPPLRLPDS